MAKLQRSIAACQRPWQLLSLAEKEWKQWKKAQWKVSVATNDMRIKLDLPFASESCGGRVGALGLINDLGVNASVTLSYSHTSSEYWLFLPVCLFEFLIILIFSERLIEILCLCDSWCHASSEDKSSVRESKRRPTPRVSTGSDSEELAWKGFVIFCSVIWAIPSFWKISVQWVTCLFDLQRTCLEGRRSAVACWTVRENNTRLWHAPSSSF